LGPDAPVLLQRLKKAKEDIEILKKKLAAERKKTSFQKKRNRDLSSTLKTLKSKGLLESNGCDHLQSLLTPTLQELFQRLQTSGSAPRSRSFPPEIRVFASTLQFYSTKAYEYVRQTFKKVLPHVTTIRKWFSNISGAPGFSAQAFELLAQKVCEGKLSNKPVFVALMLDEMSLKKQIEYDSQTSAFTGYVNISEGVSEEDPKPATEALVIMAVGVNFHFKIPIGYFFIAGLSGPEKANLVKISLQKVFETGAHGTCIITDGPAAHLTMMKELGAKLNPDNMMPFFPHPSDSNVRVHVLLDLAHMLKLVRNSLASEKVLISPSGLVQWDFIVKLFELQEKEGLRAGNKLKKRHIEWERHKMNVSVAAQTLSTSVADSLDFLRDDLKMVDFQNSEATSEFVRLFDSLFDVFNSKNILGKKFKAPLQLKNEHEWMSLLSEADNYIRSLQKLDGTSILSSRVKTGFLGFLCGISTFQNIFDDLVRNGPLNYVITYKFSQVLKMIV
jgi:Transposase protein